MILLFQIRDSNPTSYLKGTDKENTPYNKSETLTKNIDMYISAIDILKQLFIRDSYTQIKFSKK